MNKIVHFSTVHPAFDVRIFHKECITLVRANFKVYFVVPHTGDILKNNIKIVSVLKQKGRLIRVFKTVFDVTRIALSLKGDVYHFHDPELLFSGVILKFFGKKVIYDAHENVAEDILTKPYIPLLLRKSISFLVNLVEKSCCLFFDAIVTATPAIALHFPKHKTVGVYNYPIKDEFILDSEPYHSRPNCVVYIGGVTLIRGAIEMIQSMNFVAASLMIAGTFSSPELKMQCQKLTGWQKINFLGWQEREQLKDLVAQARVGVIVFLPGPNHLDAYPNKLFEYMAAGIPVVASHFPLWREIIEGEKCGLVVDPHSPQEIGAAIQWLLDNPEEAEAMGRRGATAIAEKYNWETQGAKLVELYKSLISG